MKTILRILIFSAITAASNMKRHMLLLSLPLVSFSVMAGTTGTEFRSLYNLISGWSGGYLGRTLAVAAFLIGAMTGFARSTAMPAMIGIVFAVLFAVGPGIITGIASATI